MASRHLGLLAALIALGGASCGGPQVPAMVVPGTDADLGLAPKGMMGDTYALVPAGDGIRLVTVSEESMQLLGFDTGAKSTSKEILLNVQPELWSVDETLLSAAVMTPRFEDLPGPVLEGCLRSGMSDMARHIFVYARGLVTVGQGFGVVFGARTTLECDEAGAPAPMSLEHIIVFDAEFNRIQHDITLWIDRVAMDAVTAVDGQTMRAAWLMADGVYAGGGGQPVARAVKFTDPWSQGQLPVHFFVPTDCDETMFALGVVERPMATVGQGESYLVMHMSGRSDPTRLDVSRLALDDHPQAAAAAWSGDRLGVVLFAEVRPPHAESRATATFVEFDASATVVTPKRPVLKWKNAMGKSFGMLELVMASLPGTYGAAILYDQGMGGMIDLITIGAGASSQSATYDMGWQNAKDMRLIPSGDDFLVLWSDKLVRLLRVEPPYGVVAPAK